LGQAGVVTGFFGCQAVPTNLPALAACRLRVIRLWRRTLRRCSQKDAATGARIETLAHDFLRDPARRLTRDAEAAKRRPDVE
jgi:RNA-directed DNA polymerase